MQITTESSVASMNKPKISIIVPVYNTELYLRECIESILRQSFMNFEVLLVDDGSTVLQAAFVKTTLPRILE